MFKNRVRTAALAGAIAVATGVSGVAVPAFAEDTTTTNIQGGGFNEPDASEAKDVEAKDITEAELRSAVSATHKYIVNNNQFRELYEAAAAANTDGLDRSEQADHKAYQAAANEATKQLAQAEKNVQDARASVAYALENDKGADKAWANYEEKAFDYNNTVTNIAGGKRYDEDGDGKLGLLESDLNKANEHVANKVNDEDKSNLPPLEAPKLNPVDPEDFKSVQDTPEENIKIFKKTIETYKERLDYAGWRNADKNENSYITRDYVPLLEQLIADAEMLLEQLKEDGAALEEARKAALEASRGAQGADILVRQGYLDQAHAQVRVLRAMEAEFAIGARVLELRESDDNGTVVVNGEQKTLREAYAELIAHQTGIVSIAKQKNMETYEAQVAQFKGFKKWASDEANFDGNRIWTPQIPADFANPESPWGNTQVAVWDGGTDQERLDYLAMKVAAQQLWFGPNNYNLEYEEAYRQVVNADNGVQKEIADSQAAEEQAKNERERAEQEAKDRQRIADALENLAGGDNGKDGDKGSDGKDGDNGSDGKDGDNGSDGKDGDNNKKGDKGSAKDKLSNNGKPTPLAIFGIVAGVLAAVAAAFPAIAKALNIKLPF